MLDKPVDKSGEAPVPGWGTQRLSPDQQRGRPREGLSAFLSAIRIRRKTLIATMLLIPLCAYGTLRQISPLYTATGSLIYEPSGYKLRELQSILREDPTTEAMMSSQAEILRSLHIAQKVAERGGLFANPEFNAALRPPGCVHQISHTLRWMLGLETDAPSPAPIYGPVLDHTRDRTLQAVQDSLRAAPVRFSHVVEVSFVAGDPLVAAAAVNNAMDAYIKEQYAAKHRLVDNATALLEKQAIELRWRVGQAEERMSAYRAEHALSQGVHAGTDTEKISHLTEDLVKAQSERAAANARLDAARGKAGAEAQAAVAPSVVQLRALLERLAGQIQALRTRLGSQHPEVLGLNRQYADGQRALNAEVARVVSAMEADQHVATERVQTLEHILADAKAAAEKSARSQIPLNAMSRDLDAARGQLQAVLDRIQQTAQQAAVESSEAHEISQAIPPENPTFPRMPQTMAGSVVVAVFLGLVLVYVLHLADNTLQNSDQLRDLTGVRCLALIPEVGKRALGHLKIHDYVARRPLTAFAEQIRSLRAGVSLGVGHPQIITVTGARPAEGKSLLVLSLGRSAQLGGERVLAIECDVRRASFQYRLGGSPAPGLMEVLRGDVAWRDTIQNDPISGMKFIAAGKPGGDVLGLFLSDGMRKLLEEVREHYDLILLDAPPVEAMTEARIAAAMADGVILCVRWRSTDTKTLLHTLEMLRDTHAKVIGTALTRVDTRVHRRSGDADAGVYHRRYKAYFRE